MKSTRTPWSFARSSSPGAGLVVLEAMKMENEFKVPAPAVIKAVRVQPGAAVEKGQVLLEFEDSAGS